MKNYLSHTNLTSVFNDKPIRHRYIAMIKHLLTTVLNVRLIVILMEQTITPPELFNDGYSNSSVGHCVTVVHPGINTTQAILIEILCTSFILCAACATWDPRCAHTTDSTAIRFGFSVVGISLAAVKNFTIKNMALFRRHKKFIHMYILENILF